MVDGKAVRSCLMFAVQADGCEIRTVEGLGEHGQLSVVQETFRQHHALQCGYCTPGILMTVTAALEQGCLPHTETEVREFLSCAMKPALFDMIRPDTVEEVLDALARNEDVNLLAGGQSLVPLMNLRMATPALLIDLNRVQSLSGIELEADCLRIGAMTRQSTLLMDSLIAMHASLLRVAAANVGHVQTRNRGTLGGSLAHADPAAELPVAIVALDATLVASSKRGTRQIEIRIPLADQSRVRSAFREYAVRHGDFAIASAAVQRVHDRGVTLFRVALGGVATVPIYCANLSRRLSEGIANADALQALIAEEVRHLSPMSDLQASANHRRRLGELALFECLQQVLA
jgi:CO/xanthine dehydrogenase FAD-binding subunit